MKNIILKGLELKTFTKQDALDYCSINNINPLEVNLLKFVNNELTDISGIKLFKNLQQLFLQNNKIKDISVIINLNNLEKLYLFENKIKNISFLKNLKNLKELSLANNEIKDISVLKYLNNLKFLSINDLKLDSDQIQYIKSLEKLETLISINGFKDMSILDELNKRKLGIFK